MSSPFLANSGSASLAALTNGSIDCHFKSVTCNNLLPNYPVKTNGDNLITSQQIQLSDCNFSVVTNPHIGVITATVDIVANTTSLITTAQTANNAQIVANDALPKAGGTMTGDLFLGGNNLENITILRTNILFITSHGSNGFCRSIGGLITSATIQQSDVNGLVTALNTKSPINNPIFTGVVTTPNLTIPTLNVVGYLKNSVLGVISTSATIPISDIASGFLLLSGGIMSGSLNLGAQTISNCLLVQATNITVSSLNIAGYVRNNNLGVLSTATTIPISDIDAGFLRLDGTAQMAGTLNMNNQSISNIRTLTISTNNTGKILTSTNTGLLVESSISQPLVGAGNLLGGRIVGNNVFPFVSTQSFTFLPNLGLTGRVVVPRAYSDTGIVYTTTLGASISGCTLSQPNNVGLIIALQFPLGDSNVRTSTDGINWTLTNIAFPLTALGQIICASNGNFIAHTANTLWWSTDGVNWSLGGSFTGSMGPILSTGGSNLIAVTTTNTFVSTDNGFNWSPVASHSLPQFVTGVYFNNTIIMAPATGNTIYINTSPYISSFLTNTISAVGYSVSSLIFDSRTGVFAACMVNSNIQIFTTSNPLAVWNAGQLFVGSYQSGRCVMYANPQTLNIHIVIQTQGPPAESLILYRNAITNFNAGGVRTPSIDIGVTNGAILSINGPLTMSAPVNENINISTTGAGNISLIAANQPITINSGTSVTNIAGPLITGIPRVIINLNGVQTRNLTAGLGTTLSLAVNTITSNLFVIDNASGLLTYTGAFNTYMRITVAWSATFSNNFGNAGYVLFAMNSNMQQGYMSCNGMSSNGVLGGSYSTEVLMIPNDTLQLYMLVAQTTQAMTFQTLQISVTSMLF